jgi:transcriptional regulator GlxA family with amidase domain
VADTVSTAIEGGMVLARTTGNNAILAAQILMVHSTSRPLFWPRAVAYVMLPLACPHGDGKARRVDDHVGEHFRREPCVDHLPDIAGMRRRNLVPGFKAATGQRPRACRQMLHVAAVRTMLDKGAPSIQQVGAAVS